MNYSKIVVPKRGVNGTSERDLSYMPQPRCSRLGSYGRWFDPRWWEVVASAKDYVVLVDLSHFSSVIVPYARCFSGKRVGLEPLASWALSLARDVFALVVD